VRAVLESR